MSVRKDYSIRPVRLYAFFMGIDESSGTGINVNVMAVKVKVKSSCLTAKSKGYIPCTGSPKKNQFVF